MVSWVRSQAGSVSSGLSATVAIVTRSAIARRLPRLLREDRAPACPEPVDHRLAVLAVELADHLQRDLHRADRLALPVPGTAAEALGVHRRDHVPRPVEALGLALREKVQVRHLGA